MPPVPEQLSRTIETLYRSESGRVLATLVRLLGDLDLAEEGGIRRRSGVLASDWHSGEAARVANLNRRFKAIDGDEMSIEMKNG